MLEMDLVSTPSVDLGGRPCIRLTLDTMLDSTPLAFLLVPEELDEQNAFIAATTAFVNTYTSFGNGPYLTNQAVSALRVLNALTKLDVDREV